MSSIFASSKNKQQRPNNKEEQTRQIKLLNQIFSYETFTNGVVYCANLILPSYKTTYLVELLPGASIREDMLDNLVKEGFKLVDVTYSMAVNEHSKLCYVYLRIHVEYVGAGSL